ncbi:MAG: nucleoside monophosphate kinase [Chitinivibrionales bacterium]|nr:nucleoside monophosphate kinase [Chitinivibrionales bacterium]
MVGHSNAGKSPLGALMQTALSGPQCRYYHLDFGAELRRVTAQPGYGGLAAFERDYVASVMNGRLLDNAHLPIAGKIVADFLAKSAFVNQSDVLILNGFPRNVSQADFAASTGLAVKTVIYLACPAAVACARKQRAEKGLGFEDRSKRPDQALEIFQRKIDSFEQETLPLIDYYRQKKSLVIKIDVRESTSPEEMLRAIPEFSPGR